MQYPFPGNVRELRAIIELAAVLTDSDKIDESHISFNAVDATENLLMEENTLAEYTGKSSAIIYKNTTIMCFWLLKSSISGNLLFTE